MKKAIACCLVLIMLLSGVSALAETMRVVNCDEWVSLRSAPSTSASRLAVVPLGATVEAYYSVGQFTRCYYNGLSGYILSQYLSLDSNEVSTRCVVNCKEWVTLRAEPSTTAASLSRVPLGATVEYYGYVGDGYAMCGYLGLTGYILEMYLGF